MNNSTRKASKICSRIGFALLAMIITWYVSMLVIGTAIAYFAPGTFITTSQMLLLSGLTLYILGIPVFLLVIRSLPEGPMPQYTKIKLSIKQFLLIIVLCLGSMYIATMLTTIVMDFLGKTLLPGGITDDPLQELMLSSNLLSRFILGVCGPAVMEEFVFRRAIYKKMRGCADKTYITLSAFCFALFHGNIYQMPYAFLLGLIFAWVYVQTGNFWLPVSLHFIVNLLGGIILPYFAVKPESQQAIGILVLVIIVSAVVIFFKVRRAAIQSCKPPIEPGWPYRKTGISFPNCFINAGMVAFMLAAGALTVYTFIVG